MIRDPTLGCFHDIVVHKLVIKILDCSIDVICKVILDKDLVFP